MSGGKATIHGDALEAATDYKRFIQDKRIVAGRSGTIVDPTSLHPALYDFQRDLVAWALRLGRAAIFADCGLGKTLMQLEWARHVKGPVLVFCPLSVAEQTVREASKIDLCVSYVGNPAELSGGIAVTNYERAQKFAGADLAGIVLDESSILKSVDGKTRTLLLEEFTDIPWRLCCTATPCPNDIAELANHAEFLGVMSRRKMLGAFFVHDQDGWRLRGHAREPFFRWLASWAMALKSPADLGYDASRFELPPLEIIDEVVDTDWLPPGRLFPGDLKGIQDRISVRKRSADDRIERAAEIVRNATGQVVCWCGLNAESSGLAKALGDECVEVCGTDSPESKREAVLGFVDGRYRVLVTKPKIAGFGMNFQNASTMVFVGISDSYESYYQCIRRCWRYGQDRPVKVHVVVTDHETEIVDNVRNKEREAEALTTEIVTAAKEYEMQELGKAEPAESFCRKQHEGDGWTLFQGDCAEELRNLDDDSIDMSVFSPPFLSLFTYTSSERDMGNSSDPDEFLEHFGFAVEELLRVMRPGRNVCVHCADVATTKSHHGFIGLQDFPGMLIRLFQDRGFIYHGKVTIDKDPQAQAIRTHAKGLLFVQKDKDSSWLRPALADYILVFRKPGENQVPIKPDITNDEWIEWARPIWYGIRESDTLNTGEAKGSDDDRHICALQLETIERCIRLWSNPGEVVLSPFAGIGSEGYVALRLDRRFVGIELKPLYCETAVKNLKRALARMDQPRLLEVSAV